MEQDVQFLTDYERRTIRLTPQRWSHIRIHPELDGMEAAISETLGRPHQVLESASDPEVRLYYRRCTETRTGDKLVCVVVKILETEPFVITAYLTDRLKIGKSNMDGKRVNVWYDPEGDYLEVIFEQTEGYFRETEDDRVMEKVDTDGHVLGFSILGVSSIKGAPLQVALR